MKARFIFTILLSVVAISFQAASISGYVLDKDTKEPLIGTTVLLTGTNHYSY